MFLIHETLQYQLLTIYFYQNEMKKSEKKIERKKEKKYEQVVIDKY